MLFLSGKKNTFTHVLNMKVDDTGAESPGDLFILEGKKAWSGDIIIICFSSMTDSGQKAQQSRQGSTNSS